jgi:hypothetical protein
MGLVSPNCPQVAKKLPKYPLIPATLLGRLAVSREHQGQKFGRLSLMDALHRSRKNTGQVASVGVMPEAIDEPARRFHLFHECIQLTLLGNRLLCQIAQNWQLVSLILASLDDHEDPRAENGGLH